MIVLGVTGHRPPDLGGYSEQAFQVLVELAKRHIARIEPKGVIQGMALGWDQACAVACLDLGVPYAAYIPFEGQAKVWPKASRARWEELRAKAKYEEVFGKKYDQHLLIKRNQAIVNDSEKILTCFNGYPYSGTANALEFAKKKKLEIINVYQEWLNGK